MITIGELYRGGFLYGAVSVVEVGEEASERVTLYSGYCLIGISAELLGRHVRFISSELDALRYPVVIIEVYRF
jgi:hypothetical protein